MFTIANVLESLNRPDEAMKEYDKIIGMDSQLAADAYFNKAIYFSSDGKYEQALENINKSISLRAYPSSYRSRGITYYHLKDWSKGVNDFNEYRDLAAESKSELLEANTEIKELITSEIFQLYHVQKNSESSKAVVSLNINPKGILVSGSDDGLVKLWDVKNNFQLIHSDTVISNSLNRVEFIEKNSNLFLKYDVITRGKDIDSKDNCLINLLSISGQQSSSSGMSCFDGHLSYKKDLMPILINPDALAIVAWNEKFAQDIDVSKGLIPYISEEGKITSALLSLDSKLLIASTDQNKIVAWDIPSHKVKYVTSAHSSQIRDIEISPNGRFLASASNDWKVKIWNVETGQLIHTLKNHSGKVTSVAFSPDNKLVATGSDDNTVKVWDLWTWNEIVTLDGHTSYVQDVVFSPDNQYLASGGYDNTIRVWKIN